MDAEGVKGVVEKMMFLFDRFNEIHTQNKKVLSLRKAKKNAAMESAEPLQEEENLGYYSALYASLEKRNGMAVKESPSGNAGVFDTQSFQGSSQSVRQTDHLSVITSTNGSSMIRYEELCLILLRGVMERLVLQLNPCQEAAREVVQDDHGVEA